MQELIEHLDRSYNGDPEKAGDHFKPSVSLVGTVLKITARAFRDERLRRFICDLLVTTVYGEMREVRQILQNPDENLCLAQLENYAEQIVAQRQRELSEAKALRAEQSTPREDEMW
jgi:hypothetical protein